MAKIGVAISGGGHRASLFGLGALLYLADAKKNQDVTSIASVSGGSLTNAYVARNTGFSDPNGPNFWEVTKPFAQQIAQRGTVMSWWVTKAYIGLLVLVLGGTIAIWWLPWPWALRLLAFLLALVLWAALGAQRGRVCGRAFAHALYMKQSAPTGGPRRSRPPKLSEGHKQIDHVLCATDLHAGEHVYFSPKFVCAYRFGWGVPGDLYLHTAVQCSAALPGAFPVRRLRTGRHKFQHGTDMDATMALVDGGVYDNMADQWGQGVAARKKRDGWKAFAEGLQEPDELIVVNSSAGLDWGMLKRLRVPILGELLALLRDKDVLYDNSTSLRRFGLVNRFDFAELQEAGVHADRVDLSKLGDPILRGALVSIPQSPFTIPKAFEGSIAWPGRAARATAVLDALSDEDEDTWKDAALQDQAVKTNLSKLGTATSAQLIRHGYLLAMANLHVILGYPLVPVLPPSTFETFVS
jgi:Patatin-like phospholipase